jgi:septum formation protein
MKLILGSSSKYKRMVLENAGYDFEVMNPDVDEFSIRTDNYYELPLLLARAKAQDIARKVKEPALVIGSDIVVVCGGKLYEKPETEEQARAWLKKYSNGHKADCPSGLCVINTATGKMAEGTYLSSTSFKEIPDEVIEEFIEKGDPYSKAGGFNIHLPYLQPYIKEIGGSEEGMMGMPLELLKKLIKEVS